METKEETLHQQLESLREKNKNLREENKALRERNRILYKYSQELREAGIRMTGLFVESLQRELYREFCAAELYLALRGW